MILVIGSTGLLGGEVCRLLSAKNLQVNGLVRKTSDITKSEKLKELGVGLVYGDLRDSLSLQKALEGVTTTVREFAGTLAKSNNQE